LREAIARSRNIATIKLLRDVGVRPLVRKARELGIESPLEPDLSLALGSSEMTLAELLRAYATFPAGGKLLEPIFVLEVRDRDGAVLERDVSLFAEELEVSEETEEAEPAPRSELEQVLSQIREAIEPELTALPVPDDQVLDPVTAFLMTNLLRAVVQEGTGWRVKQLRRPVGGKTGTTNDLHDAWFLGFTPDLAAGAWVGYDAPRNLGKNETGSRAASPIFLEYMQRALAGVPPREFEVPEGVVFARIDRKTGLLASPSTEQAVFQAFREGTSPKEVARTEFTFSPELPPRLD
jgi:penicillin-binding protein 1A